MMTIEAINHKLETAEIPINESRVNPDGTFTIKADAPTESIIEAVEFGKMNNHKVVVHDQQDNVIVISLEIPASKYSRTRKPNSSVKGKLRPDTWFSDKQEFIKGSIKSLLRRYVDDSNDYESIIDYGDEDFMVDVVCGIIGKDYYYEVDGYLGTGLYAI